MFDRNRTWLSLLFDVSLAAAVAIFAALLIAHNVYRDLSLVAFAFVVAGAHYSLLKSVQPDAASPVHGFNWLVAYSRPVYFCVLAAILLGLQLKFGGDNSIDVWNWNVYRVGESGLHGVGLALRDITAMLILLLPIAFTMGWLPQVNTLTHHVLEQIEMHLFGGVASMGVVSAILQLIKSLLVLGICSALAHLAYLNSSDSTQSVLFAGFAATTVSLAFLLSRQSSNPSLGWMWLSYLAPCQRSSNSTKASETSSSSASKLLCVSSTSRRHSTDATNADDPSADDWQNIVDPLPEQLWKCMQLRSRHDMLFSFLLALLVFALHCTSLFTATQPYFQIVISCITVAFGFVNHYLYAQLRAQTPWKTIAKPILRSHEFGQFETTVEAKLTAFEVIHVWMLAIERNLLYPLLTVSSMTSFGWQQWLPWVSVPLYSLRLVRGGFAHPQLIYPPLTLAALLTHLDWAMVSPFSQMKSTDLFPPVLFVLTIIYPKCLELQLKLNFVLAYVAPWQISWGSAFHAFAQPFAVPHSALTWLQTLVSSLISAPLNPFLGSSFFTTSYVRPVKFWEKDYNTKRTDASNTRLAWQIDRGPTVDDANLNAVEAISEDLTEGAGCCCCSPGSLPGFLSLNTAWTLRWLAWEVHELRRLLVTLYVKCICYYTITSSKLTDWLLNDTVLTALEPIISNDRYVDLDHMFCAANDEDFDPNLRGISKTSFNDLYQRWIHFCLAQRPPNSSMPLEPESVEALCMCLSVVGRRALGAAAFNRHSSAAESFLYGLHALFKGDFRVTCQRDEWVFADMDLLRCVIAPAVRMALKLHQDHFTASDDFDSCESLYALIGQHQSKLFISHEHDPAWRRAIIANTPSLLALRHVYDDGQDDYKIIMLNKMHLNMRVIKLNRECVRAFWAGQQQELIFLRNRNPERGSIQNARQVLRNMINSSADQPIGYPIYVSPLTTSFVETHSQIRKVTGAPITVQGIASVCARLWTSLRSHFGTSGSSNLPSAGFIGGHQGGSAPQQPTPQSSLASVQPPDILRQPIRLSSLIKADEAEQTVSSSQIRAAAPGGHSRSGSADSVGKTSHASANSIQPLPENSVVTISEDGVARVSIYRRGGNSSRSPASTPPSTSRRAPDASRLARDDSMEFAEIMDVEQIFKHLDEPLRSTGEPLVVWPCEEWRKCGGRSSWEWMPLEGWSGRVVHKWYPNHPMKSLRSHTPSTIYLLNLRELPNAFVPVSEAGIRHLSRLDFLSKQDSFPGGPFDPHER